MAMTGYAIDETLVQRAVRYLLEQGAAINLIGDTDVPSFEIAGEPVSVSQVVLRAYAAGMADAA